MQCVTKFLPTQPSVILPSSISSQSSCVLQPNLVSSYLHIKVFFFFLCSKMKAASSFSHSGTMGDEIDLTGDGGVIKRVLRKAIAGAIGPTEERPVVDVHYEGCVRETGEVFASTHVDNTLFSFELGKDRVIRGWTIAIKSMKVGEVATITCKPEYGFGVGYPPDVPPEATVEFELELVACRTRKGGSISVDEMKRLEEAKKGREIAASLKIEEKKRREEAKAAAAARAKALLDSKKGRGKGKSKAR